jgi:hypothetical protein
MVGSQILGSILIGLLAVSSKGDQRPDAAAVDAERRDPAHGAAIEPAERAGIAGDYFYGDGLGVNVGLTILESGRFSFIWRGCLGVYDQNAGSIEERDGVLYLTFDHENVRQGFRGLSPSFVPVRWGKRLYLVVPDDLVEFCNAVNQGLEPRDQIHGQFLLRRGDEEIPVGAARPDLPQSHRGYLLETPIEARVIDVIETKTVPSKDPEFTYETTTVVLDAGSRDGIRVGMELVCHEPASFEQARVVEVGPRTCKAEVKRYIPEQPLPVVGWKMSTARPATPPCDEPESPPEEDSETE